ncbi:MAG: undecaprenyl-phosphate galactose phosphotransferase WbaP [Planctomycetes bacterium]|nr:undecaprenyl-phosphate galactose phosphotransferase WbaP [Planctomycetota bacterium]
MMIPELASGRRSVLAVLTQPWLCVTLLVVTDLVALLLVNAGALLIRHWAGGMVPVQTYQGLWPLALVFVTVFAAFRLYEVVGVGPAEELKRIFYASSFVYLLAAAATFVIRTGPDYSRGAFLIAWAGSVVALPLFRTALRSIVAKRSWWGVPVAVLGAGMTGRALVKSMLATPQQGLKPIVMLDDDASKCGDYLGVPVLQGLSMAPMIAKDLRVTHAILAMPGAPVERLRILETQNQNAFPHLVIIPNLCGFASLWVNARDLGGVLGLEVRRNLLLFGPRLIKRSLDLVLCTIGGIAILPFIALVALCIKLESRGPVFYSQQRVGRNNTRFNAWKFRSMVENADQVLETYLATHPELRAEWNRDHKLRNDPRVTRVGRFLRKTSLDELPQIWNAVLGQMSLVGPRPIVDAEMAKYEGAIDLYLQVRPGISGLWQVSGRNDTTYAERVMLDSYYVRNWSVWLDIHILIKTIRVVLMSRGAY